MPKQKLTGAVNKPQSKSPETAPDAIAAGANNTEEGSEPTGDSSDGDEDPDAEGDSDEPEASGDDKPGEGSLASKADRSLEAYRETFGHEQGSVLWADGTSFVDACTSHIQTQAKALEENAKQIADLTASNESLAKQIHGESDPVDTRIEGAVDTADPISAFAEGLELPSK